MEYAGPKPSVATPQPLYARYVHGVALFGHGKTIEFTPDGSTDYGAGAGNGVPFGAVLVVDGSLAIATVSILPNVGGALAIEGVFDFPTSSTDTGLASGASAYWDSTNHIICSSVEGNIFSGKVQDGAMPGQIRVRIEGKQ